MQPRFATTFIDGPLQSLEKSGFGVIRNADGAHRLLGQYSNFEEVRDNFAKDTISDLFRRLGQHLEITPVHYAREGHGHPFTHISPSLAHPKSLGPLRGHTDGAFLRLPFESDLPVPQIPELIVLYCVRNFDGVATTISPARDIVASLDTRTVRALQLPIYSFSMQASWTYDEAEVSRLPPRSILDLGAHGPLVRFSHSTVSTEFPEGKEALTRFSSVLGKTEIHVCLNPGDLLVIDNQRTVHGRRSAPKSTNMGPAGRWLIRSYFQRNKGKKL